MPDWRRDLSYDLMWHGSAWGLPTPLWFWDETDQPDSYMRRWGMLGWKWLG